MEVRGWNFETTPIKDNCLQNVHVAKCFV